MPPRKTRKRKSARPDRNHRLKVAFSALFLLGFLIVSLVLLAEWRESFRRSAGEPPRTAEAISPTFEQVRSRLEEALLHSGVSPHRPPSASPAQPIRFEVPAEFPEGEVVQRLGRRLRLLSPLLAMETRRAAGELRIYWDGDLRYLLRFQAPAPPPLEPEGARLAIIMDDLGRDVETALELLRIDLPVTFSVLPNTPRAAQVATVAHGGGREVMIHLPMEPRNYPQRDPGYGALFLNLSPEEIRLRMATYIDSIPYASGGNNHMGSRFTESSQGMAPVLEVMKEQGLFFVDSLTSGESVAFTEARRRGIPATTRDVFLDNEREVEKIFLQIRALAETAVRRGRAVGICHPYPETLEALRRAEPFLEKAGVRVVPVSRLLEG